MSASILLFGGLDTSGGAGLAVDLRVCGALKARAFPIATCLAVQSDQKFVTLKPLEPLDVQAQFDAVKDQRIGAVKIGALGSLNIWTALVSQIKALNVPVIVDPVLTTSTGSSLVAKSPREEVLQFYLEELAPHAGLLTPNYDEAMQLTRTQGKMTPSELATKLSAAAKCPVLLKGGHGPDTNSATIQDTLCVNGNIKPFQTLRMDKGKIRGTGCALATAVACYLAAEKNPNPFQLEFAVKNALNFLGNAIKSAPNVGNGVFHLFPQPALR